MAVAELPIQRDPFAFKIENLDAADPIDSLLISCKQESNGTDYLVNDERQRELILGLQQNEPDAAGQFVSANIGLIAGIAYLSRRAGVSRTGVELLKDTKGAFMLAATQFALTDTELNSTECLALMADAHLTIDPSDSSRALSNSRAERVEKVLKFIDNTQQKRHHKVLEACTDRGRDVLPLLPLPYEQIAEILGCSTNAVQLAVSEAKKRKASDFLPSNTPDATAFVLELHSMGVMYDVKAPKKPFVEALTNTDMDLGHLLEFSNTDIAESLNLTPSQVSDRILAMKKLTGAESRPELALMIKLYDTGERQDIRGHSHAKSLAGRLGIPSLADVDPESLLRYCTARQRVAIEAYYLADRPVSWEGVGKQINVHPMNAKKSAAAGIVRILKSLQGLNQV